MDIVSLEVQTRDPNSKASDLRNKKLIPIEYYGHGVDNKSLQADYQDFRKAFRSAGSNTVISMKIDDKNEINVLIHDVTLNPVTDAIEHVDMINVRMDEEITTQIPLEFNGRAPAVKELGGILMTHLNEVEVKCLPKDLIHSIEVSIDSLIDFHSFVRVKDLEVPSTIEILNEPEDVVVTVVAPRKEEEEEPAEEGVEGEEGEEGEAKEGEEGEKKEGEADNKDSEGEKKE